MLIRQLVGVFIEVLVGGACRGAHGVHMGTLGG